MRYYVLAAAALWALMFGQAHAQSPMLPGFPPGTFQNRAALDAASSGGCSEATTFLARTSGLSGTETNAYTTMICGMVADGVWAKLDLLYIFATNTTTTAKLNLISTSFTLSDTGAPTFTADQGYAGSSGNYLTSTYNLSSSGTAMTQNSASVGAYILNNRTSASSIVPIGNQSQTLQVAPHYGGSVTYWDVNDGNFPNSASTTSQGLWFATRTAASGAGASNLYRNGNTTPFGTDTGASSALANETMSVLAYGFGGNPSTDTIAAAWVGGGFTNTQMAAFASRLNAYMTALGINVY